MAEKVEVVIKIPKYYLTHPQDYSCLAECVRRGVTLQNGHGKLIDEKEINTVVNGVFNVFDKYSPETFLKAIHEQCIEAVGADKTESERI